MSKRAGSHATSVSSNVDTLHAMCGVDRKRCARALKASGNDVDAALRTLISSDQVGTSQMNPELCTDIHYALVELRTEMRLYSGSRHWGFPSGMRTIKTKINALRAKLSGKKPLDAKDLMEGATTRRLFLPSKRKAAERKTVAEWKHARLGTFRHEGGDLRTTVAVPAFTAFTYGRGKPSGKTDIVLSLEDGEFFPPKEHVALVEAVIKNAEPLTERIARAVWRDFQGRGSNSGMWWHGDLEAVTENVGHEISGKDICSLLRLYAIHIRTGFGKRPLAELDFHAAFEEEHGVGILTDATKVRGIGYVLDVMPFDW